MANKYYSNDFYIDKQVKDQFIRICDELGMKINDWARFFIQFELDLLRKKYREIRPNSDAALNYLDNARKKRETERMTIQMSDEIVKLLRACCQHYNVKRVMIVEFALRNANVRIPIDEEISDKRTDLKPLYLLERSFKKRLSVKRRIALVKEQLVIGNLR